MNDPYTEDHNSPPENPQHPPLMMGFGFLPRLLQPGWISLAFLFVKRCPKYFLKPAVLISLAMTAPPVQFLALVTFNKAMSNHGPFTGSDIFTTFVPVLIGGLILAVGALAAMFWGLGALLIALTATCRTFLIIDSQHFGHENAALERAITTAQEEGMQLFRNRKAFLATVWLMYSLFMILPTLITLVSSAVLALGAPSTAAVGMPMRVNVPLEMMAMSGVACCASLLVLSNYALILFPLSALTQFPAAKAALNGMLLTLKTLPAISIYSVIFFVLASLFSYPIDLLVIYNQQLITGPLAMVLFLLLKLLCHILFFVYLVPISMLIPCEMVRGNIE